jgi:hypothetical protein
MKTPTKRVVALLMTLSSLLIFPTVAFADSTSTYNAKVAAAQAKIDDLQNQLTSAQQTLSDWQNSSDGQAKLINDAQTAQFEAQQALDAAKSQYDSFKPSYDSLIVRLNDAEDAVNAAVDAVNLAADNVDSTYIDYQNAQTETDNAQTAMNVAQNNYDTKLIPGVGQGTPGLVADVYTGINRFGNPPSRSDNTYTKCKTTTVSNIDTNWGGGDIMGCGGEYIMIHYHGYITYPTDKKVYFYANADDGFYMNINGQTLINDWSLKGCGANSVGLFSFKANTSYPIDAWFYEWTGGACASVMYQPLGSNQWSVAPSSFFTQTALVATQKDPALKVILDQKIAAYVAAVANEEQALTTYNDAITVYEDSVLVYENKQLTLSNLRQSVNDASITLGEYETTWQNTSDDFAVKDAALTVLKAKYAQTFNAINNQIQLVDSLESQLAQAKIDLANIPKPTPPTKAVKKVVTKSTPVTKTQPKSTFVPVPKK